MLNWSKASSKTRCNIIKYQKLQILSVSSNHDSHISPSSSRLQIKRMSRFQLVDGYLEAFLVVFRMVKLPLAFMILVFVIQGFPPAFAGGGVRAAVGGIFSLLPNRLFKA